MKVKLEEGTADSEHPDVSMIKIDTIKNGRYLITEGQYGGLHITKQSQTDIGTQYVKVQPISRSQIIVI